MLTIRRLTLSTLFLTTALTLPAHAVSKEMIQLQTQVQQLQEAVARLQQSNDERMGVLKDLVQQTADSVNRMSLSVGNLQQHITTQQEAAGAKSDQLSGQVQSLNDSLDELKARMARMDKALQNIEGQQQSTNAALQNLPSTGPPPATGPAATGNNGPTDMASSQGPAPVTRAPRGAPAASGASGASSDELYRSALGDYMAGKYPVAASEFADIIQQFPDDNLSGNAYFYLGEINNKTGKPAIAIKDYDRLLEHYPDNAKIPAAHLHKADALVAMKQNDAGVRELRSLIQRFPNSPESAQARSRLNALGVPIVPRNRPAAR